MTIQFGDYILETTNGVYTKGFREMQGAERSLTILKTFSTRGVQVLSSVFQGKVIELTGEIIADDSTDLITLVRDFVREMSREGQPLIYTNDDGVFIYDGTYVTNTDQMVEIREYDNQHWAEFRLVILCPKGFARSNEELTTTVASITSLPYTGSITITGDTNPEPVITITLTDASTITDVYFTNTTTNQQISVRDITFADGDILSFNTETKEVTHDGTAINFNGVFPDFLPGLNNYQITASGANSLVVDQQAYNSETSIYGNNWIAQSFQVDGAQSISQLELLIKKVAQEELTEYDNFNDASIDTNLWTVTSNITETGGYMIMKDVVGNESATTNGETGGNSWRGAKFFLGPWTADGALDGIGSVQLVSGANDIRFDSGYAVNTTRVRTSAGFGSIDQTFTGHEATWDVRPVGSNVEIYQNSTLVITLTGVTLSAYFKFFSSNGSQQSWRIDNVSKYVLATANTDLTVRIETNNAGAPSGSLVTNGSLTILASNVGDSFSGIIKQFATAPSLSDATTYHLVIKQTGGDVNNYYVFKKQNTNVYADGNLETTATGAAPWTQTTEDLYAKLWGASPTSFILALDIKYFASYFNIV